ncbi:MAG: PadR family transcriptional regulator [Candidatus Lokiarchaeota archaeon]|nr:PadR family transcriptional regulator [Candidatus Lokiarchaeota archaeon]
MDKAVLIPLGYIERYQKPRRLGIREPHVRSTILARWDVLLPVIDEALIKTPQLRGKLEQLVGHPGAEVKVSRGEYDQFGALLDAISGSWTAFLADATEAIQDRLATWHQGSRRGLFRLLVLMAGVTFEGLKSKGFGGAINKAIKDASNGAMEAKPGSLYVAIKDFTSGAYIANYDVDAKKPIWVTAKGKAFIIAAMNTLKSFFDLLRKVGFLDSLRQEHIAGGKGINDAMLKKDTFPVDLDALRQAVAKLPEMVGSIGSSPAFEGASDVNVRGEVESWQDNVNRGAIDIFILGALLSRPMYGNALISEAEAVLGIPTGTLYPKLKDFKERGLVSPVSDGSKLASLNEAARTSQGPPKVFYEITPRGALYLVAVASLYLADLAVFMKLGQALLMKVHEPGPAPKSKSK